MIQFFDDSRPYDPLEEINALLQKKMQLYNQTPDPAVGGLSPEQVHRLIHACWSDSASPLQVRKDIPPGLLQTSPLFRRICHFLKALQQAQPLKATTTGNLPRSFVKSMVEPMLHEKDWQIFYEYNKVINEKNLFPLHIARLICDCAGIAGKTRGSFIIRKKSAHLLEEKNAGHLFATLAIAYFQRFNLGYTRCGPDFPSIQRTIAYSLLRLQSLPAQWIHVKDLPPLVLLPPVAAEIAGARDNDSYWTMEKILENHLIEPLFQIGFLEVHERDGQRYSFAKTHKIRPTELLRQALIFDLNPQGPFPG